jgi:hypothetical protein
MGFNKIENEYLNMFKTINSDFIIRFTPKFRMSDSVVEGRLLKVSDSLRDKGYDCKGYIVKDYGKVSGLHFHSNLSLGKGDREIFKLDFLKLIDRFGFNGFIENNCDEGGYEEYMVSKLKLNDYWVGLWEN